MKHLSIVIILVIMSSCCSTRQVSKQHSEHVAMANTSEKTKTAADVVNDETSLPKDINTDDTVIETVIESIPKDEAFTHTTWDSLLEKHVAENGNVNYKGFAGDIDLLRDYIVSLSENRPSVDWSKSDILAYWINAYNAMTVDLILRHYPVQSIKDIKDPWKQRLWKLGEKWYNLDEIEHQILRKMDEPRIHFAIVCASYSCPTLSNAAYTATNLESQLSRATTNFLNDPKRNKISTNSIEISKIFQWFAKDFKRNGSLIDFLNQYSIVRISKNAKKRFATYNWSLNE